ncbi:hypothetical protein A3E49_02280 [Candidatus Saccharibacteria bacterium RIFCSPHIGHO2_12_FULL_49_19]|nr:MAG: hypothetical protein A2708_01705 [Candidatus Saccharibacteria bacterium RIFCSPHIGHO2_01_FULL_49_21]OGL37005.1 MAG: hypothetical protein A3E49_02280 [Candidatus Saccharibacteria bacterium RIFCSPHIGHO2_12_FULL_49_19]OGL38557.1 MAG: hypothetical protein A3B63_02490 [Candidatus Saccharibacteria bacterium RIFCSPLOWO2_01_FULL_49_22]
MATRNVHVAGVGEVNITKRKNNRHLRLTITPTAKVRISIPYWAPYGVGIAFARSRADWIRQRLDKHKPPILNPGALIGKTHRLYFRREPGRKVDRTQVKNSIVAITSSLPFEDEAVQALAYSACERALKLEAEAILPRRVVIMAEQHGFFFRKIRIRKLTSRWGSCSNQRDISLSYFLIQLPWELIDYVILHELVHTRQLNHGTDFWRAFERAMPNARVLRQRIKDYQPALNPA